MIYCFDTYYKDDYANTAVVGIEDWGSDVPAFSYSEIISDIKDYESGSFYKRELPCLVSALEKITLNTSEDFIIIDGYVVLSDHGKLGLGGHLYEALEGKVPIIGVAKNDFRGLQNHKKAILQGNSKKPLYLTSLGINLQEASDLVMNMSGENRIPTILKLVDQMSRLLG